MSTRNLMGTVLVTPIARTEPGMSSSRNPGSDSVAMRDAVYRCLQLAVEVFDHVDEAGQTTQGATALAEAMGAARSDTFLRVQRKEDSKGSLQRAFLDFLAPLFLHPEAKRVFVEELMTLLGYEKPIPRKRATEGDIGGAWLKQLAALPPGERDGRIADMATALGVRVEDLKAMAGVR